MAHHWHLQPAPQPRLARLLTRGGVREGHVLPRAPVDKIRNEADLVRTHAESGSTATKWFRFISYFESSDLRTSRSTVACAHSSVHGERANAPLPSPRLRARGRALVAGRIQTDVPPWRRPPPSTWAGGSADRSLVPRNSLTPPEVRDTRGY